MATVTEYILRASRFADEPTLPATDQGDVYIYFRLPLGYTLEQIDALNYSAPYRKSLRYLGNVADLSQDCGQTTTPVDPTGNPTFTAFSFPPGTKGQDYSVTIGYDEIGIPFAGQTMNRVIAEGLPDYLFYTNQQAARAFRITGKLYSDNNDVPFSVVLEQSDGRIATKPYVLSVGVSDMRVYVIAEKDTRRMRPLLGSTSTVAPTVQIVDGPSGFDAGVYTMRGYGTKKEGIQYDFDFSDYLNVKDGEYALKFNQGGIIRYAKVAFDGNEQAFVATLTTTQPTVSNGGGTTIPVTPSGVTVVAVDIAYTAAAVNTIDYVQARLVVNNFGSNSDLFEVQMMDSYADTPMYIAIQLQSQGNSALSAASYVKVSSGIRNFALGSGQNLRNKPFRIFISTTPNGQNVAVIDYTSGSVTTGFVKIK